jgi:hypothetical protein
MESTMYQLQPNDFRGQPAQVIKRLSDNAFIPFDPANTDAAEFAKWLQDGNIPEAAEEGGTVSLEWVAETIAKLLGNTPEPADEVTG